MAWVALTYSSVGLAAREREAIEAHITTTRRGEIIAGVLSRVRSAARSGGAIDPNTLTVPPEVHLAAADIVRYHMLAEVPAERLLTDARKTAYEAAERIIAQLAAGKLRIERPDPPEGQDPVPGRFSPRWKSRPPRFSTPQQTGVV
jgi:hypothetical protein